MQKCYLSTSQHQPWTAELNVLLFRVDMCLLLLAEFLCHYKDFVVLKANLRLQSDIGHVPYLQLMPPPSFFRQRIS